MISICIPIYNYYAYPLVRRLSTQIQQISGGQQLFEIICIDDHSSGYYLNQNNGICDLAQYLRLSQNIGRARIRNLFLKYAKGEWLLFLDCDSLIPDRFLSTYLNHIKCEQDVIVGGRIYDSRFNDPQHRLRYLVGTTSESVSLQERRKNPYTSFLACNFLIRRSVFERIKFDPRLSSYGYEGLLLAYRLKENNISILHLDNPVTNGYVETNAEYLNKAVESIGTLASIYDFMWEDQRFCHAIPILNTYATLRRLHLVALAYRSFRLLKSLIESHLVSGKALFLKQFRFYLLATFIQKIHYSEKPLNS